MAENTQIISGYIVRPNGDPFTEGVVRFTLGRSDTDEDEVIAAGKYVEFDIATDGSFAAELWPNTRGNVGGAYVVQVHDGQRTPFETVGRVQVQDDGPYDLAALLRADIPQATNTFYSVLSQDEYDAFVAEMDAKVVEAQGYAESYDVAAISAAVTATGEDAAATAADRVATGEDATATAADRVATGEDVIAAADSAQAASDAAAAVPDIKTFDTYAESVTYGESNPAALIFCRDPQTLFTGAAVFWSLGNGFNPGEMFSDGEVGAWYDPSDLGTLWQDTAGTVPVTSAGQSVARISDKSGNGNHLTQVTASKRGTYQTDGVNRWVEFDGVDDAMQTAAIDFANTEQISIFAGVQKLRDSSSQNVLEFSGNIQQNSGSFNIQAPGSVSDGEYRANNKGTDQASAFKGGFAPEPAVLSALFRISTDMTVLRINGSQEASSSLDLGTGNYGNYPLYLGTRAGSSHFFNGRVYGLLVVGRSATNDEIGQTETHLADKSGVTL
ncbi:MAG: hypothetical protein ABJO21_07035 [Marinomonas sp.]